MTTRYNALTVVLEHDMRDDDAAELISAIRMLRGVLAVEGNVPAPDAFIAELRVRNDLEKKLWDVLHGEPGK